MERIFCSINYRIQSIEQLVTLRKKMLVTKEARNETEKLLKFNDKPHMIHVRYDNA